MDDEQSCFSIDELADLGGVSRRTVRYYVQEGLLPAPLGVGRGRHYASSHLDRLLHVKAEQEAGRSLEDIRARRRPSSGNRQPTTASPRPLSRSTWRRLELSPGVELHVAHHITLPAAIQMDELVEWCRRHLSHNTHSEE